MKYSDLYKNFIVAYVASADAWENAAAVEFDETHPATIAHRKVLKTVKALELALIRHEDSEVLTIGITGYHPSVDHYEIDDAMKSLYGDEYLADSENGSFFGFCSNGMKDVVIKGFEIHFPELEYTMTDARETVNAEGFDDTSWVNFFIPGAGNWGAARETLKKMEYR